MSAILPEVNGHEGQPYDARGVHGERDVLGFVEGGRYFAGDDGVHGAQDDEADGIGERHHVRDVSVRRADQQVGLAGRIVGHGVRRSHPQPGQTDDHCNRQQQQQPVICICKYKTNKIQINSNLIGIFIKFRINLFDCILFAFS